MVAVGAFFESVFGEMWGGGGGRSEGDDQPAQLQGPQEGWGWWLIEWWLWMLCESIVCLGGGVNDDRGG